MNQESRIKNQGKLKSIIHDSLFMIPSRGFVLIELIIVIVVIGIISAIGTGGLIDYTRTAKLNAAANGLITTLNTAKSNALSQVKDSSLCGLGIVLDGYKVVINNSTTYDLRVACGGDHTVSTKSLPANITFTSPTPASFLFLVLKGGVIGAGTITLSGYGKTRSITVTNAGVIK